MNIKLITKVFLLLIAVPTLLVGIQGLLDPQAIMDNVQVALGNNSGKSSTRAIYGGMHLMFAGYFIYGAFQSQRIALLIMALYGVGFVIGRLVSLAVDGQPNEFISTWIFVEAATAIISIFLMSRLPVSQE